MDFGKWEVQIPARPDGSCAISHLSEVKIIIRTQSGLVSRLSPFAKYVVQPAKEANQGTNFKQIVWNPPPHEVGLIIKTKLLQTIYHLNIYYSNSYRDSTSKIANQTDLKV